MTESLLGDKMIVFFERLQKPVCSREELLENVRKALEGIAEQMQIGKVTLSFSAPRSLLREQIDNDTVVLFQNRESVCEEAVTLEYRTGEGGIATLSFFSVNDSCWPEEEQRELLLLGNMVLWVFRLEMTDALLKRTMTMDLNVSMPNMTGFIEHLLGIFRKGNIGNYIGFYFNTHNFKYVNKVLAHQKADEVMRLYTGMLMQGLEKDECVARLGGDNFVAVIRKENVEDYIRRISNMEVIYQDGEKKRKFSFGATIGGSELEGLHDPGEVMVRISNAYQAARQKDSKDVVYYSEEIHKEIMRQKDIIAGFYRGIEKQEFEVYYQPKVRTKERRLCGAEALIRWKKDGKMISPMEFIPVLEKEGSICTLDFYVLDKVCELLSLCIRENRPVYTISVNFSKRHMENRQLAQEIVATIDKYNVPHKYIEVELTESEDVKDYIVLARLIDELKAAGVCASVDDFGTGYSSLNMLKMINTDILKIDKSFIPFGRDDSDKRKDCIMFESILQLAKALGFQIVAEGVETQQQYEYMYEVGCDIIQGYYFDRPLPKEEFLNRLSNGQY